MRGKERKRYDEGRIERKREWGKCQIKEKGEKRGKRM